MSEAPDGWRPDGVRETFVEAGTEVGELRYTRPLGA